MNSINRQAVHVTFGRAIFEAFFEDAALTQHFKEH
jgi:hypothetical protein